MHWSTTLPFLGLLASKALANFDITAETNLTCGGDPNPLTAGYLDLDTGSMFWTLFHGKGDAKDNGLVIQFGGGPGATPWDHGIGCGAAPCQLAKGQNGTLEPSPYPWTEHANLLLLDYPIGAGWSYNNPDQIAPNSSLSASYDFDTFLQVFLETYPKFIEQPIAISSNSYGGFLAAYIADTVTTRNEQDTLGKRIKKNIDTYMLGNPFGDVGAELRWRYNQSCLEQPPVFNEASCAILETAFPKSQAICQDSLLEAELLGTLEARSKAYSDCVTPVGFDQGVIANQYNRHEPACNDIDEPCFWWQLPLMNAMGSPEMTSLLNVRNPDRFFWFVNSSALNFYGERDNMQNNAFLHFSPGLEAGSKLLIISGEADTVCPWQESWSFMKRLPSPYLNEYLAQNDTFKRFASSVPATGTVLNSGTGYSLLRIVNGSHYPSEGSPELFQHIVASIMNGEDYDPTAE